MICSYKLSVVCINVKIIEREFEKDGPKYAHPLDGYGLD